MPSKEDSMEKDESARRRLLSVCDPSSDPSIGYYDQCFDLQQEYDDDTICASHASRTSTFTTDEKKRYKKNKGLLDKVWKQAKTYMGPGWRITYDLMKKAQMFGKSGEPLALTLGIQGNVESFAIEDVFSFSCDSIAFDMEPRPFNWTVYISRNKFAKFDEFADGMVDFELSEFSPVRRRLQSYDFGDVSVHRFDGNDPLFVYPSNQLNDWIWRNQGSLGSDYDLNYTESACDNDADIIDVDGVNSLCEWGDNLNFTLNIAGGATKYSAVSFEIYIYKTAESTVNDECVGAGSAGILKLIINDNIELVSNSVADLEHKWTHVVFMDNDLYINKVNVGSLTETTQAPVTSDILKRVQVFGDFIACVSSAQVFNRSLSASEIDELHDTFTINTSPEAKVIDKHMKEKGFSQGIDDFFEDPINKFIDIFDDIFKIGFKAMKQVGEELFNAMKEGIMDVISKVTGVFKEITDAFDTLLDKLNVIYAVKKMLQGINILLEDVASNIGQAADGIKTAQKQLQNAMDKITNSLVQIVDMPWFPSKIKVCVSSHCDKIKVPKYFKKQIKKELTKVAKGIKLKVLLKPVFKILKQIRKYLKHMKSGIKLISKRVQKAIDALKHFEDDVGTDDVVATNTTITSHCDNQQTISMSEDGGNSFSVIGLESDNSNFHNPWSYTIPRLTQAKAAHTVFKFSCKNMGGPGGFIASVHHDDAVYSTTNPIDNGYFSIVSSASSPLVYTRNGGSPWYATSDKIASDAHWIWDGSTTEKTLEFEFRFNEVRKVFAQCDNTLTVSLSTDGGATFTEKGGETNWEIAWSYSFSSLTAEQILNTVFRFACQNTGGTGGFIASVHYDGRVYSTSPRGGAFESSSSSLVFTPNGQGPWHTVSDKIASDAFWIWDGSTDGTLVFELDFSALSASTKPHYYFSEERMTYVDAKYFCMRYFGATLATLHSVTDNVNAMESMNNSESVWIGRYENTWEDNHESEWNNYASGSDDQTQGNCVYMNETGYWFNHNCDTRKTFICNTDGTIVPREDYAFVDRPMTRADAQTHCETHYGTNLGTVHWQPDNDIIRNTANPSAPLYVRAHCDNWVQAYVSQDGSTFSLFGNVSNWNDQLTYVVKSVSDSTVLRFDCANLGGAGGFIATVTYKGITYWTTNPITDGVFTTTDTTNPLTYTVKKGSPWNLASNSIASDAHWIWNGQTDGTMRFELNVASLGIAEITSKCDDSQVIKLSTDAGSDFAEIGREETWPNTFSYIVQSVSDDTVLRFECTTGGGPGGFIASVNYNGQIYSTTNPLTDGRFTTSDSSSLTYTERGEFTDASISKAISYDAYWIGVPSGNTMTFDFNFGFGTWIGYQTKTDNTWGEWVDGSADNYTNWANTPASTSSKCCYMKPDGKWNEIDCDRTKTFVCGIVGDYVIVDQPKSFDDALQYCETTYGTSLASIYTPLQNQFLYDLKQSQFPDNDIWIGLRKHMQVGEALDQRHHARHWFVDGTDHWNNMLFWDDDSPSLDEGCAVMNEHETWSDRACANEYRFACSLKAAKPYIFVDIRVSPADAVEYCQNTYNTSLATIANQYQNDLLYRLVQHDSVWIGLQRTNFITFPIDIDADLEALEAGEDSWIWMEQNEKLYDTDLNDALANILFTNWYQTTEFWPTLIWNPYTDACSESTAYLNQKTGEWKNSGCDSTKRFACNNPLAQLDFEVTDDSHSESQYSDYFELVIETEEGGMDTNETEFMAKLEYPRDTPEERDMWIIKRLCFDCVFTYETIYYRRYTVETNYEISALVTKEWKSIHNVMGVDFNLYSSYEDALNDNRENAWQYCNDFDVTNVAAFGDCAPSLSEYVADQWNGPGAQKSVSFYIHRKAAVDSIVKGSQMEDIFSKFKPVIGSESAAHAGSHPLFDPGHEPDDGIEPYGYSFYYEMTIVATGFVLGVGCTFVVMRLCDWFDKKQEDPNLFYDSAASVC
eukprot:24536_1